MSDIINLGEFRKHKRDIQGKELLNHAFETPYYVFSPHYKLEKRDTGIHMKLKVSTCPWCSGDGHHRVIKNLGSIPGTPYITESVVCKKCEGD